MTGYLQALIDSHYLRLGKLNPNQKLLESYEINFIEELENALSYCKNEKATKDTDQSSPR